MPSAIDDLRKLIRHAPALALDIMTEHIPNIGRDPKSVGEKKLGDLPAVRAYGFNHRGVSYRIVFSVEDAPPTVTIVAFGAHDDAYRRARNR